MKTLKQQILDIRAKRLANYNQSSVTFEWLLKELGCSNDELAIAINGAMDSRVEKFVIW